MLMRAVLRPSLDCSEGFEEAHKWCPADLDHWPEQGRIRVEERGGYPKERVSSEQDLNVGLKITMYYFEGFGASGSLIGCTLLAPSPLVEGGWTTDRAIPLLSLELSCWLAT